MAFGTVFIFLPPELLDFRIEPRGQRFVAYEFERFLPAHKMPVMLAVAIVVTKYSAVIYSADAGVDVGKTVLRDACLPGLPYFFLQLCTTAGPLQIDGFIDHLLDGWFGCPFPAQGPE